MALLCAFSTLVFVFLVCCSDVHSKPTVISVAAKAAAWCWLTDTLSSFLVCRGNFKATASLWEHPYDFTALCLLDAQRNISEGS